MTHENYCENDIAILASLRAKKRKESEERVIALPDKLKGILTDEYIARVVNKQVEGTTDYILIKAINFICNCLHNDAFKKDIQFFEAEDVIKEYNTLLGKKEKL